MLTFQQASLISNSPIFGAVFKAAFAVDPLFAMLPWARVIGRGHTYAREGTQIAADFITGGGSVTSSAQTFKKVTAELRTIAASAQIEGQVARNMVDNLDQAQVQISAVARALARELKRAIVAGTFPTCTLSNLPVGLAGFSTGITAVTGGPYLKAGTGSLFLDYKAGTHVHLSFQAPGDVTYGTEVNVEADGDYTLYSADGVQSIVCTCDISALDDDAGDSVCDVAITSSTYEFDGLASIVTNTVTGPTATGDNISFALLRYLIDQVDPDAGQRVLVMPPRTIRAIKTLADSLGNTSVETVSLENYGLAGGFMAFEGIPILRNDYLPVTETKSVSTCSSVYCLSLAQASGAPSNAPFKAAGICGLYGAGQSMDTDEGPTMGVTVKVDDMPRDGSGLLQDAVEVAVFGDYGLANYGPKCSARLYGILN